MIPGSGILLKSSDTRDHLYLINLGSGDSPLDLAHAIRSEDEYRPADGDRILKLSEIRSVHILPDGWVRIRARRGGSFVAQPTATADAVAACLAGLPLDMGRPERRFTEGAAWAVVTHRGPLGIDYSDAILHRQGEDR